MEWEGRGGSERNGKGPSLEGKQGKVREVNKYAGRNQMLNI